MLSNYSEFCTGNTAHHKDVLFTGNYRQQEKQQKCTDEELNQGNGLVLVILISKWTDS